MKKIIVTLCSLVLSLAGTFGINQLASNDEAIIYRNTEQVDIEEDAEADAASNIEEDAPKAEDTDLIEAEDTKDEKEVKETKEAKKTKETKKAKEAKKADKYHKANEVKKEENVKQVNKNNGNGNNNKKNADNTKNSKADKNNAYVYKNVDLSKYDIPDDILTIINNKINNKSTPTKPAPTATPSQPTPTKPAPTATPVPTKAPTDNSGSNQNFADEVLRLVNIERSKAGLSPLTTNATLKAAADKRAQETEISFSHTRPNGSKFSTVLQEYGISYRTAGENIAYGQRSPQEVVNGWMNSPGHRANILNSSFGKIGIGVYQSKGVIYWTQLFTN